MRASSTMRSRFGANRWPRPGSGSPESDTAASALVAPGPVPIAEIGTIGLEPDADDARPVAPQQRQRAIVRWRLGKHDSPGPSVSRNRNSSSCSEPLPVSTDSTPTSCASPATRGGAGNRPRAVLQHRRTVLAQGRLGGVRHLRDRERFGCGHTAGEIDGVDCRLHWISILSELTHSLANSVEEHCAAPSDWLPTRERCRRAQHSSCVARAPGA